MDLGSEMFRFNMVSGAILEGNIGAKLVQTSIEKLMDFLIAPGRGLGSQKEAPTRLDTNDQGPRGGVRGGVTSGRPADGTPRLSS